MQHAFFYSETMQLLLFFVSAGTNFLFFYLSSSLLMQIYCEKAPVRKRLLFAFLGGIALGTLYTYGIYALGGFASFTPFMYAVATVPNPLTTFLLYLLGVRVLGLAKNSSLHIMWYLYVYILITKFLLRLWGGAFFAQTNLPNYNYMLDTLSLLTYSVVNIAIYFVLSRVIRKSKATIMLSFTNFFIYKQNLHQFIGRSSAVFLLVVIAPMLMGDSLLKNCIIALLLTFVLIVGIVQDAIASQKTQSGNKDIYINLLADSLAKFKQENNGFYDIIHQYSQYIDTQDIDGLKNYHQKLLDTTVAAGNRLGFEAYITINPTFASLLEKERAYAYQNHVTLSIGALCDIDDLYMSEFDASRTFSNLLNNAIEAAAVSKKKYVSFSMEHKQDASLLIIISNTTAGLVDTTQMFISGVTTKDGHTGLGLTQVRNIIAKYENSSINCSWYNQVFTIYVTLRQSANLKN